MAPPNTPSPAPKKPAAAAPKAAPAKPPAAPAKGDGKKPAGIKKGSTAAPVKANMVGKSTGRRIGQVLVDLGFIDEEQLWEVLEEAKATGALTGQVAIGRGLLTEDQLQQALGEQFGLKTISLEDAKPQPEATTLVPETMAT